MTSDAVIGSRIRERREAGRIRQADLARQIGISASYLNLIEHNRRRIGGKLLLRIASALGVEVAALTEGAGEGLLQALRRAEAGAATPDVELTRIEEFAGRFPGWAALIAAQQGRIEQLEQLVGALNDRLAHDPALAASVHEVLSTAASIRSTASILAETEGLGADWLGRFHANINEDSARLAESSRALAQYLETDAPDGDGLPQQEVEAFLEAADYHFPALESEPQAIDSVIKDAPLGPQARILAREMLRLYARDAAALPAARLRAALSGPADPVALAAHLNAPVGLVMRRLACLPELKAGYVLCDRSGSLLLRKGVAGFSLPRFGASCPLWPVFQALSQPGVVLRQRVTQLGGRQAVFDCYAMAEPIGVPQYNVTPFMRAGMLILHAPPDAGAKALPVGASCRVCPSPDCAGRREPSILSEQVF